MSEAAEVATERTKTEPTSGRKIPPWRVLVAGILLLALLALLAWGLQNSQEAPLTVGNPSPDFQLTFFDGYAWQDAEKVTLADFQGQVVVINFWASWCIPCRTEAGVLEDSWQRYRDQGVVFLGIAYLDTEPKSMAFLQEFNVSYPNGPDLRSFISDRYEITGVPETFIVDGTGKLVFSYASPIEPEILNPAIEQALAQ